MPDETVTHDNPEPPPAQIKTEAAPPPPTPPPRKVADRPHWVTILLGSMSPLLAIVALYIAWGSLRAGERSMKVGQRAYLNYEVTIANVHQVIEALRIDKDFLLTYQVKVTNMGNTPADSIYPKLNVVLDPDRTPVMITFPSQEAFDLGPKESRVLPGQALFAHVHHVRSLPGFSSGFTGQIEYKDVFGDSQAKKVCYQFVVSNDSARAGLCGTVMQLLQIK